MLIRMLFTSGSGVAKLDAERAANMWNQIDL